MSRVGKKPIKIPEGVSASIEKEKVSVKGPKGELFINIPPEVEVKQEGEEILVSQRKETKRGRALWGTIRSLIANMIKGVSEGYKIELQIKGVGYKAEIQGEKLVLKVGFSHPVEIDKVEGVDFAVSKDIITVSGIEKELVGRLAAEVRMVRPPEPYKGKGIRYKDEEVTMKEGKKSVGK